MYLFLGARPYDFTDDKTGQRITGVSVHFAESDLDNATGYISEKVSMSNDAFARVFGDFSKAAALVMKPVLVSYNKWGKPEAVRLAQAEK